MAIEQIGVDITLNYKEIENKLSDIDSKLIKLSRRKIELQFQENKFTNAQKHIQEINNQIKRLSAQKISIQANNKGLESTDKRLAEIDLQLKSLRSRKLYIQANMKDLESAHKEFKTVDKELTALNRKKTNLNIDLDNIQRTEASIERVAKSLSSLGNKKTKISISQSLNSAGTSLDNIGSKLLNIMNPFEGKLGRVTSMIASGLGFTALLGIAQNAISSITSSLDGAINRYDTINMANKVFAHMGFTAEETEYQIGRLTESIKGLPTPLNDAMKNVQVLTASMGDDDLGKAVDLYKAINNGILGFGGSTEQASNAITQLSQDLGANRIYARTWLSLMDAGMTPVLVELAESMGMSSEALKEGLGSGAVSVDEFTDALIKLNKEGTDSMSSLQAIANDAKTTVTSGMTNVKNAVQRGGAQILTVIDAMLTNAGQGGISGMLGTIGDGLQSAFYGIADWISQNQDSIISFFDTLGKHIGNFVQIIKDFNWGGFFTGLIEGFGMLKSVAETTITAFSPLIDLVVGLVSAFGGGDFATGIGKLIPLLFGLAVGLKLVGKAMKFLSKHNFGILGGGKGKGSSGNGITDPISGFASGFDFSGFATKLSNIALVAAAGGALMVVVEALSQLNKKIPSDIGKFTAKLLNVGIAIGGFTALAVIIGKLPTAQAFTGLGVIAIAALDLMLVAEAISQLNDKIPRNLDKFKDKLIVMAVTLAAFGGIVAVIGGLVATGIGALIGGAGLVSVIALAGGLVVISEAIANMDKNIPNDVDKVIPKIEAIEKVLDTMNTGNLFTAIYDLAKHAVQLADKVIIAETMNYIIDIAKSFKKLQKIDLKYNKLKKTITSINNTIELLGDGEGIIGGLLNLFDDKIDSKYYSSAKETIDNIVKIANKMVALQSVKIKSKTVNDRIDAIKKVIEKLDGITFDSDIEVEDFEDAKTIMESLTKVAKSFDDLESITVDVDVIDKKITDLGNMLSSLAELNFKGMLGDVDPEKYKETKESLDNIIEIANSLSELMNVKIPGSLTIQERDMGMLPEDVAGKVTDINAMLTEIAKIDFRNALSVTNSKSFEQVVTSINHIQEIIAKVSELMDLDMPGKVTFDQEKGFGVKSLKNKIEDIQKVLNKIGGITFNATSAVAKKDTFKQVTNSLKQIQEIIAKVSELMDLKTPGGMSLSGNPFEGNFTIKVESLTNKIEDIQKVLNKIGAINLEKIGILDDPSKFADINTSLETLKTIISEVNTLATTQINNTGIETLVTNMETAFNRIDDLTLDNKFVMISTTIAQVKTLSEELNALTSSFMEIGENYGKSIIDGFTESDFSGTVLTMVETLMTNLGKKISGFKDIGKRFGNAIKNGFSEGVNGMGNIISSQLLTLYTYSTSFGSLGTSYGNSFLNGFSSAIGNIGRTLNDSTSSTNTNRNLLQFSKGGEVPEYHSKGGIAGLFRPRGTDTVPAMLTPGERITNAKASKKWGRPFMDAVNRFDVASVYKQVTGGYTTDKTTKTGATTIINNNQTTNDNRKVEFSGGGKTDQSRLKLASRWFKYV